MGNKPVTESYDSLFDMGEKDILVLLALANYNRLSNEIKNPDIIYHVSMAVEKFLKGYLIKNNIEVQKIHEIEILQELRKKHDNFPSKSDIIFDISNYDINPVIAVRNATDNLK